MSDLVVQPQYEIATAHDTAAAEALVKAQFSMASVRPRDLFAARKRILDACSRPRFAPDARYKRPVGKDKNGNQTYAEGFSIRFVEAAVIAWGNVSVTADVVYEDENKRKISVTAIDLETNASQTLSAVIEKTVERSYAKDREIISERENSYGGKTFLVKAFPHEVDIKEAAIRSKLIRNCVIRLIPSDILEEAADQIKATMLGDATKDPIGERKKLVDAFAGVGVTAKQLSDFLGHSLDNLTPDEIVDLRGIFASIKNKEAKWTDFVDRETPVKSSLSLDDITPGDPAAHTPVDEPLFPQDESAATGDIPHGAAIPACEMAWIQFCEAQEMSANDEQALFASACEVWQVTHPALIPDDKAPKFRDWLIAQAPKKRGPKK